MAGGTRGKCLATVSRRKTFELGTLESGKLKRCLNRWDLTGLGVGSTLGVGTYVLLGYVALNLAGPSVILSFLVAAVAALLAGLCYAEFASRIPRAGTAYIYTYFTMGELAAFIVGWCNILEGLFGTASIAKGLSLYVDEMTNRSMSEWFTSAMPITAPIFSPYFDMFSFLAVLAIGVLMAVGARESSRVSSVLTAVNVAIICFVIFAGSFKANSDNWYIPSEQVPPYQGAGGFFPHGVWGTLRGAAVCFYGFVGFETISSAAEETRDPRMDIPIAILITLVSVFFIYIAVAIVVTMMVPYYLQDSVTPVASAFSYVGWEWAWWVVSVGTVAGITVSLYGAMFPLPRLLYAMSSDGLSVRFFSKISTSRKSPIVATAVSACVIATLSGVMELEQMLMMLCIGTLLSFTGVAISVILLRYRSSDSPAATNAWSVIFGCRTKFASTLTTRVVMITLGLFICVCLVIALVLLYASNAMIPILVLHVVALVLLLVMACQPKVKEELNSKTPLVPLVPCLSIYVNIHLMVLINGQTWLRVLIWLLIGIPVYLLCICCFKRKEQSNLENNIKDFISVDQNGKAGVQIIVESPTPPGTIKVSSDIGGYLNQTEEMIELQPQEMLEMVKQEMIIQDEIVVQQATIENNEEKEANIIDLLDQVIQAEEDRYIEIIPLKEEENNIVGTNEPVIHRKSLSELSDAGSDASLGNQGLSKYDVIAQVHREDLPIVSEEEEKNDRDADTVDIENHEEVTRFNDSETNSRTDESGYSDTIMDRTALNDSTENVKEEGYYIPPPPPLDENYFKNMYLHSRTAESGYSDTIVDGSVSKDSSRVNNESFYVPPPPPLDENYFAQSYFKKSYSMPKPRNKSFSEDEIQPPRESVQSNNSHNSQGDGNIVFGSDRQFNFMSKLSNVLQVKINTNNDSDDQEQRKRSLSTGNVVDNTEYSATSRPLIFAELKKQIIANPGVNLRPVNVEPPSVETEQKNDEPEDESMSRTEIKSKLESIFATGGTTLFKPRLMKSNPPTPEDAYQTESSTESIPKMAKIEKNDTLSRQKAKFGAVLNSIRLSYNSDDQV